MRTFEKNGRRGRRLHDYEGGRGGGYDTNDNAGWPFDHASARVFYPGILRGTCADK